MRYVSRVLAVAVLSLLTANVYAALSQPYIDWGNGPARWLMTREEQRAWANIQTDDQAKDFVELFWARRDPTPGTWQNEFKAEFDQRVKYADEHYGQRGERGSMTERGRALVVLGFPPNSALQIAQSTAGSGANVGPTPDEPNQSGHQNVTLRLGNRDEWKWEGRDAQQRFGMPRVDIVFVQDPNTMAWKRDTQRPDFILANDNAIRAAIHNPDLKAVPDWARTPAPKMVTTTIAAPAKLSAQTAAPGEPGVHKLVLMKNVMSLPNAQEGGDPFLRATPTASFTKGDDLGYAFEYCGSADTVKLTITITGMSNGNKMRMVAPTDDVTPDPMRAVPGCGMVRASIPLSDLTLQPGTYNFQVKLEDGAQTYNLAQDFRIE